MCASRSTQLRQLNKRKRRQARKSGESYEEVEIGIGLSMGRVIMGNMGCAERMEHTVIGSTVNLAALCSHVPPKVGRLSSTKTILEHIGKQGKYEEIQVKGFKDPVPVRRLSKADTTSNMTYCRGNRSRQRTVGKRMKFPFLWIPLMFGCG